MREYKIVNLGRWSHNPKEGKPKKVSREDVGGIHHKDYQKESEYTFGFQVNDYIIGTNEGEFLDLEDVEILFNDLSKEGWLLDSIKELGKDYIGKVIRIKTARYIAIFYRDNK